MLSSTSAFKRPSKAARPVTCVPDAPPPLLFQRTIGPFLQSFSTEAAPVGTKKRSFAGAFGAIDPLAGPALEESEDRSDSSNRFYLTARVAPDSCCGPMGGFFRRIVPKPAGMRNSHQDPMLFQVAANSNASPQCARDQLHRTHASRPSRPEAKAASMSTASLDAAAGSQTEKKPSSEDLSEGPEWAYPFSESESDDDSSEERWNERESAHRARPLLSDADGQSHSEEEEKWYDSDASGMTSPSNVEARYARYARERDGHESDEMSLSDQQDEQSLHASDEDGYESDESALTSLSVLEDRWGLGDQAPSKLCTRSDDGYDTDDSRLTSLSALDEQAWSDQEGDDEGWDSDSEESDDEAECDWEESTDDDDDDYCE
ncbi:unnamed protein product [Sympodiomycopsis kandeliae]